MNFEKKLQGIIKKFNIETKLGYDCRKYDLFADTIYEEWEKHGTEKKVAIYGGGIHTEELLKVIKMPRELKCVIDNHSEETIKYGVPVIPVKKIAENDIDLVIISSYKHREQMKKDISIYKPDAVIIDFYQVIQEKNIPVENVFYEIGVFQKYFLLNKALLSYKKENGEENKQIFLQNLISGYIAIRDFKRSEIYIQEYISLKYKGYERYKEFYKELQDLLAEMKQLLNARVQNDVVIFMIDSLKQQEIKNMKFLSKFASENFIYENYISEYPATRQTLLALLTGWHNLDDELYKKGYLQWDDSEVLQYIHENHYNFHYMGNTRTSPYSLLNGKKRMRANLTATQIMWYGINELAEDKDNGIYILHTDAEVHPPHLSGEWKKSLQLPNSNWTFQELEEQYRGAVEYTDDILQFYIEMIEQKNGTYIIMGDHGLNLELEYDLYHKKQKSKIGYWGVEDLNPALIIASKQFGKGVNKGILSTSSFHKLLLSILKKEVEMWKEIDEEQVILQFLPSYNKKWTKVLMESENYDIAKGLIGLWNKQETYLLFEDDTEMYFSAHDNKQVNFILNSKYKADIEMCRKKLGRKFPKEILQDKRFELHNLLLKEYSISNKLKEK